MNRQHAVAAEPSPSPATRRLSALAPLGTADLAALNVAVGQAAFVRARREIVGEGAVIRKPRMIVSGWAARMRLSADGRRQFLSFLLPGDLIGMGRQPEPVATSTITALTGVELCPAPSVEGARGLEQAYAMSQAIEEAYLLEHIVRLGRLNALERIVSLLLELHERLTLNGMAQGRSFDVPLTQEILADALGLTPVHVNRMLQQARRGGDLLWQNGRVTLYDPAALADWVGRRPTRVSAAPAV